jgi:hypothetical protein
MSSEGQAPEEQASAPAANGNGRIVPVAKLYRSCPETEFKDTLVVRTMVELVESKRMDTCSLNGLIIEYYHSNLRNVDVNPRPESWSDRPLEYLKHSFFATQEEWDEYESKVRLKGKPSPTNPEAGIPTDLQAMARPRMDGCYGTEAAGSACRCCSAVLSPCTAQKIYHAMLP